MPSYLALDICRQCKNQDIGITIVLHLRRKTKQKEGQNLTQRQPKILCPENLAWLLSDRKF